MMTDNEKYYSLSMLRYLAYDDDVNGNCDGKIDFSVIDCLGGADVAEVKHGEWKYGKDENAVICSICGYEHYIGEYHQYAMNGCPQCLAKMDGALQKEVGTNERSN